LHRDGSLRLWQGKGSPRATGGVELLAQGQADSKELLLLEPLRDGRLLAADSNDQLHLIRVPDLRSGELERTGALSSGHQVVNALLAVSDDRLVSGDQADGRLCFWKLGEQLERLPVDLSGAVGPCLTGNLGGPGADQAAIGVWLAPLPHGALLSATNLNQDPSSGAAINSVVLQRWQPPRHGRVQLWTVERLTTPISWRTITSLESVGAADVLVLGNEPANPASQGVSDASTTRIWRWNPLQPATPPRQIRPLGPESAATVSNSMRAVPLPGGEWLTASSSGGALQRWRAQGSASLQLAETMETGLNAISTLTTLPGGRFAVIASAQQTQEEGLVQVFDLREKIWVGQPILVPRPLGVTTGTVAATALAILPQGGLAIGTNTAQANLLLIQPRRILERACLDLKPFLAKSEQQRSPSPLDGRGIPETVIQLSREACKEYLRTAQMEPGIRHKGGFSSLPAPQADQDPAKQYKPS